MRPIVDTNVLLRILVADDEEQAIRARPLLDAPRLAMPIHAISELCWMLRSRYRYSRTETLAVVQALLARSTIDTDRRAAAMEMEFLAAGADLADGVIAAMGGVLGGDMFVSFDAQAIAVATRLGLTAQQP